MKNFNRFFIVLVGLFISSVLSLQAVDEYAIELLDRNRNSTNIFFTAGATLDEIVTLTSQDPNKIPPSCRFDLSDNKMRSISTNLYVAGPSDDSPSGGMSGKMALRMGTIGLTYAGGGDDGYLQGFCKSSGGMVDYSGYIYAHDFIGNNSTQLYTVGFDPSYNPRPHFYNNRPANNLSYFKKTKLPDVVGTSGGGTSGGGTSGGGTSGGGKKEVQISSNPETSPSPAQKIVDLKPGTVIWIKSLDDTAKNKGPYYLKSDVDTNDTSRRIISAQPWSNKYSYQFMITENKGGIMKLRAMSDYGSWDPLCYLKASSSNADDKPWNVPLWSLTYNKIAEQFYFGNPDSSKVTTAYPVKIQSPSRNNYYLKSRNGQFYTANVTISVIDKGGPFGREKVETEAPYNEPGLGSDFQIFIKSVPSQ